MPLGQSRHFIVAHDVDETIEKTDQSSGLSAHPSTEPLTEAPVHSGPHSGAQYEGDWKDVAVGACAHDPHGEEATPDDRGHAQDPAVDAGKLRDLDAGLPRALAHVDLGLRRRFYEPSPVLPREGLAQRLVQLPGLADRVTDLLQE